MAARVSVTVLSDGNGNFFGADGKLLTISTDSQVFGTVQKPNAIVVPPATPTMVDTLQVNDPYLGTLFLLMTWEEYSAAVLTAINMTGGSSKRLYFEADGATSFELPANAWFMSFAANPAVIPETLRIGTTLGGSDILAATPFGVDDWHKNSKLINMLFNKEDAITIYISGARDLVRYEILLL